jgi:DHA1 family bicyclomycin/chloramphenicol resistance-like MFS transporter
MAGFAVSPVAYGMLSDQWGRRPLLIAGLALFALGGVGCVLAPSIGWLLAARLLQGAGAGCGPTLAFAATRDELSGRQLGQRLALLTMLLNTAPVVAPSLGTAFLVLSGWRGVYVVLALCGIALFAIASGWFRETVASPPADGIGLLAKLRRDGRVLLGRPEVLFPGLIYGFSAGSMFAYVSTSPLLLMQGLGASPLLYAGLFAVTGGAIACGALLSGRLLRDISALKLVAIGLALSIAGPIAAALLLAAGATGVVLIVACVAVATFGYGLIAPAAAHATLEPVAEMAGVASALMNSFQMACMALSSLIASLLFTTLGIFAPSAVMVGMALASSAGLYGWSRRQSPLRTDDVVQNSEETALHAPNQVR